MKIISEFIFILCLIIVVIILIIGIQNVYSSYEGNIGKSCIIQKDTLQIIDFSAINNTYILSNGVSVNYKLVESNIIKDE